MEFLINEFLSLKLENDITLIYVAGELFRQCKFLLLEIPVRDITSLDNIKSIDEAAQELNRSLEPPDEFSRVNHEKNQISPETEFWGHCSNLQAWYENDYNTKLLHSNIAFPLLKKLTEAGDRLARSVFKDEIAKRYNSGIDTVRKYLEERNYLSFLTKEEFCSLIDANAEYEVVKALERMFSVEFCNYQLDVRNGQVIELHLNNLRLKELPEIITQFKSLEILDISVNSLEKIPIWIDGFKKLKELNVDNNNLKKLPQSIGNLSSLEKLVAFNNEIIKIPDSIGNLSSLKVLDLRSNELNNLPIAVGDLPQLEELMLESNKIKVIPETIGNLESLKTLVLGENDIEIMPKSLGKLNSLEILSISNNNLTELPDSIGNLINLKILGLANNSIKTLPYSFKNLVSLRRLFLDGNPIGELPEYIYELPRLTILFIRNTKIRKPQNLKKKFKEKNISVNF